MTRELTVNLIVASTIDNGIGLNGDLPWRLKNDLKYFRYVTTNYNRFQKEPNVCIMGRATFDSIPAKCKPLKDRLSIVLSSKQMQSTDQTIYCSSTEQVLQLIEERNLNNGNLFCIGGSLVYKQFLPFTKTLFLTRIFNKVPCDTFIDIDLTSFRQSSPEECKKIIGHEFNFDIQREGDIEYQFQIWVYVGLGLDEIKK